MSNYLSKLLAGCLILVLWMSAAATLAAQTCSPPSPPTGPLPVAHILDAVADGTDLYVDIWWEDVVLPATAVLKLSQRNGDGVAGRVVIPQPGEITTEFLAGALADFDVYGLEYVIGLSGHLAEPLPLRVGLDCSGGRCRFALQAGVSSEALLIDPKLDAALAALAAVGSSDLLGDALDLWPELTGQVASLALELGDLDSEVGIPIGACSCLLTAGVAGLPGQQVITRVGQQDPAGGPAPGEIKLSGTAEGPGASHGAFARIEDKTLELEVLGRTAIAVDLQCLKLRGWDHSRLAVVLPGSSTPTRVPLPMFQFCRRSCDATAKQQAWFKGRAEAVAAVSGRISSDATAEVAAEETAYYVVDGGLIFVSRAQAWIEAPPGASHLVENECRSDARPAPVPTVAVLLTGGAVTTDVSNVVTAGDACAFGEVANSYQLTTTASASCALRPDVEVTAEGRERRLYRRLANPTPPPLTAPMGPVDKATGSYNLEPWCR